MQSLNRRFEIELQSNMQERGQEDVERKEGAIFRTLNSKDSSEGDSTSKYSKANNHMHQIYEKKASLTLICLDSSFNLQIFRLHSIISVSLSSNLLLH